MAFSYKNSKGTTYYLHASTRNLKDGKKQQLFYFAKVQKEGSLDKVPEGYMVSETKNGLPVLKRK
ncbi:MAG TPA: hypothetical protein VI776_05800 [Anaerolineales bacterium]|nr:hypothetical protein [Anaerolineales bacterium]